MQNVLPPEEQKYIINRFKQEAKILAKLRHPNLPVVSDYFVYHGRYYLIMDYVEGEDLDTLLGREGAPGLPEEKVIHWALEILDVLEYLHSLEPPIIYRDLKPSNIMVANEKIMIIDFGIARTLQADDQVTQTKIGTPHYSAPEQFKGRTEQRSDLYSLGATIHHLITGTLSAPCKFDPVRQFNLILSKEIEEFLMKALQDKLEDRFLDASQMKKALERIATTKRTFSISSSDGINIVPASPLSMTPPRVSSYINSLSKKEDKETVLMKNKLSKMDNNYWKQNIRIPGETFVNEMVLIPAGDFWFGENDGFLKNVFSSFLKSKVPKNLSCPEDVRPKQKINLQAFYIDKYPVTNLEYKKFIEATGYKVSGEWKKNFSKGKENFPVVNVSWYDAQEFARWSGKRLPTEQEWEKAARGRNGRIWPWGNEWDCHKLNSKEGGLSGLTPVWNFPEGVSPYGIFDMCGNVWEWTGGAYMPYGGNKCFNSCYSPELKVVRGGAWNDTASQSRTFIRASQHPDSWFVDIGFRCVKSK